MTTLPDAGVAVGNGDGVAVGVFGIAVLVAVGNGDAVAEGTAVEVAVAVVVAVAGGGGVGVEVATGVEVGLGIGDGVDGGTSVGVDVGLISERQETATQPSQRPSGVMKQGCGVWVALRREAPNAARTPTRKTAAHFINHLFDSLVHPAFSPQYQVPRRAEEHAFSVAVPAVLDAVGVSR